MPATPPQVGGSSPAKGISTQQGTALDKLSSVELIHQRGSESPMAGSPRKRALQQAQELRCSPAATHNPGGQHDCKQGTCSRLIRADNHRSFASASMHAGQMHTCHSLSACARHGTFPGMTRSHTSRPQEICHAVTHRMGSTGIP